MEAAKALDLSHSTLLRQIAQLEKHLGVTLLYKSNQGIQLSNFGHHLYTRSLSSFEDIDSTLEIIRTRCDRPLVENRIRLFMPVCAAEHFLNHIYPVLDYDSQFMLEINSYLPADMTRTIGYNKTRIRHFDIMLLWEEHQHLLDVDLWNMVSSYCSTMQLYASRTYLQQHGRPGTPGDLRQHHCILPHWERNYCWKLYGPDHQWHYIPVKGNMSPDLLTQGRDLAANGQGIALLPGFLASGHRELERVLPEYYGMDLEWSLLKNNQPGSPHYVDWLAGKLKAIYSGLLHNRRASL